MTDPTERDTDLGRAIDALPVPEHRSGFWDEFRAGLAGDDLGVAPGSAPVPASTPALDAMVLDIDSRRPSRPGRFGGRRGWSRLLAAAAAVAVIAAGAVVAIRASRSADEVQTVDSGPPPSLSTTIAEPQPEPGLAPTTTVGPSTATDPGGIRAGAPFVVVPPGGDLALVPGDFIVGFSGQVEALLPGGRAALVSEPDPDSPQFECGGSSLFSVDLATGDRRRIEPAGSLFGTSKAVNAAGDTAGPNVCETFYSGISLARWDADGSLLAGQEVGSEVFPGDGGYTSLDFLDTLRWTADGSLVMATGTGAYALGGPDRQSAVDLGVGPALWADRDVSGRTAAVLASGEVVFDGEIIATVALRDDSGEQAFGDGTMRGITGIQLDADGGVWVASAVEGVVRIVPGESPRVIDPVPAARLVPTAGGMLWISGDPAGLGPFTTRGLVKGTVTTLLSHGIDAVDPTGTRLGWIEAVTGSDGTTSFTSTVVGLRPAP